MWWRFPVGMSLLLIALPAFVLARDFRVGPVYTTTTQPGEVSVVVELPPGITPKDARFRLLAGDTPVAIARDIKSFEDSGEGLALAFLVDVSGTMAGTLPKVKAALLDLLVDVRRQDRLALISFADDDKIASPFGDSRTHFEEAVRNLKIRGNKTRLYQAIYKSSEQLQWPEFPKRRRIVVISDGKDEGSTEESASAIAKSQVLRIPIDTVRLGKIEGQYRESLRGLSATTGGYSVDADPAKLDARDALKRLYGYLSATYSWVVYFSYEPDNAGRTMQNPLIELQWPGQRPSRAEIREPIRGMKQLPPPPPPPWWLLAVVPLGIGLVVLVRWAKGRRIEPVEPEITPQPVFSPPLPPQPTIALERPRRTQVGGYHFPAPGPGRPAAVLIGIGGPSEGQRFFIEKELLHIGASPENDLPIMHDDYVSGRHAYLRYEKGSLFIFDENSRNGTFVNQQAVTAAGFALSLGDHIRVGMSVFEVAMVPS
jgi:von Willebrand factor type A domain/Inner membrane component of T3SS, cytoplasmic domain